MRVADLVDPWFNARFVTESTREGHCYSDVLDGADGVWFWCPCGYGKPEFPIDGGRPHALIVSFANPLNAPVAPPDAGSQSRSGGPTRWTMSGTGLKDLTLTPSIAAGPREEPPCWHGYITNGEVTT